MNPLAILGSFLGRSRVGGQAPLQPGVGNPLLSSDGTMPQGNQMSQLFPGRIGSAIDSGALMASMIPTGNTIGENIQGVAGAVANFPYARLMRAHQMAALGDDRELQAKLGLIQAQTADANANAAYRSGRNSTAEQDTQIRANERLQEAQYRAMTGHMYEGIEPANATNDPNVQFAPGTPLHGMFQTDWDEDKHMPINRFIPSGMSEDEYNKSRYGQRASGSTGAGSLWQNETSAIANENPTWGADQVFKEYHRRQALGPIQSAAFRNTQPASQSDIDMNTIRARQQADTDVLASLKQREAAPAATERPQIRSDWTAYKKAHPNTQLKSLYDYQGARQRAIKAQNQQAAQMFEQYRQQPVENQTGFGSYLRSQNFFDPNNLNIEPQAQSQTPQPKGWNAQTGKWE